MIRKLGVILSTEVRRFEYPATKELVFYETLSCYMTSLLIKLAILTKQFLSNPATVAFFSWLRALVSDHAEKYLSDSAFPYNRGSFPTHMYQNQQTFFPNLVYGQRFFGITRRFGTLFFEKSEVC